jgi:hypothetical protein
MKAHFLIIVSLSFATIALRAQERAATPELPPLPPGPLIQKRAPEMCQWLVSIVGVNPATSSRTGASPEALKGFWASQTMFTKTKDILRQEFYDQKESIWTTWCVPGFEITIWPDGRNWIVQTMQKIDAKGPPPVLYIDFSKSDFPGFEWLSVNNYAGIQNVHGNKCIVFKDKVLVDPEHGIYVPGTAYIDFDSRFPVELLEGSVDRTYDFKNPPAGILTLPPLVQALLNNRMNGAGLATFHPVKAY